MDDEEDYINACQLRQDSRKNLINRINEASVVISSNLATIRLLRINMKQTHINKMTLHFLSNTERVGDHAINLLSASNLVEKIAEATIDELLKAISTKEKLLKELTAELNSL